MPFTFGPSITSRWRKRLTCISASAASIVVPGDTKRTSRVITSDSGVVFGSRPALTTRSSRSRSVNTPATRPSSVSASSAPTSAEAITSTASATVAAAGTEISSSLPRSRTTASTVRCVMLPPSSSASARPGLRSSQASSRAEIVEHDVLAVDPERREHRAHRLVHRAGPAHVVLDVLGRRVILEVVIVQHLVDEAGVPAPVVLGQRLREREVPREVRVRLRERLELVDVERFGEAPRAVPE